MFHKDYKKIEKYVYMFLVFALEMIQAYMFAPKQTLMITTRSTTPYNLNTMGQMRSYMEPIYIQRISREKRLTPYESHVTKDDDEKKPRDPLPGFRRKFMDVMFSNSMIKVAFFTIACILFFFIGYQTRKSQESNSYVRLPTTN